ncbi:MAG: hypothetical protein BroJett014_18560 [Planctomycetota bacterium]|nr:MAG: hypothetical protein BroJett014_18560 [Planctomycetota bacterium]
MGKAVAAGARDGSQLGCGLRHVAVLHADEHEGRNLESLKELDSAGGQLNACGALQGRWPGTLANA